MQLFETSGTLVFPEAPRWRDGRLWISDVHDFTLKSFDGDGGLIESHPVPERPSGLGFLPDGRLLMATGLGRKLYVLDQGRFTQVANAAPLARGLLNDMVVGPDGCAYVGDTGYDLNAGETPRPGQIFRYQACKDLRVVETDVTFPNGMAMTPDGRTLYVAETFANRISAYAVAADGSLHDRRVHAEIDGQPDGMCLDAEGALWVATLTRGQFQRIDRGGRTVECIDVAPQYAISCALGGADRLTLFLCTAAVQPKADGTVSRRGRIAIQHRPVPGAGYP